MLSPDGEDAGLSVGGGIGRRAAGGARPRAIAAATEQRGDGGDGASRELASTRTGVPTETKWKSHWASYWVTRTQPCEAAYDRARPGYWCIATPPTNGDAHSSHSRNGVDHQRGNCA